MHEEPLRKGEQTQSRILDAAYALFMEQGYHGTSMRQIVERAGITMGGVYNHFASKEDIWVAVLFDRHPYRAVVPMLHAAEGDTAEAFVRDAARRLVGELSQRKDLLHIMFIELVEFNGVHIPALYARIAPELSAAARCGARTVRMVCAHCRCRCWRVPFSASSFPTTSPKC
jgi:AcrR family transcriptional regulator